MLVTPIPMPPNVGYRVVFDGVPCDIVGATTKARAEMRRGEISFMVDGLATGVNAAQEKIAQKSD